VRWRKAAEKISEKKNARINRYCRLNCITRRACRGSRGEKKSFSLYHPTVAHSAAFYLFMIHGTSEPASAYFGEKPREGQLSAVPVPSE
jgi:hypothetical protein